MAQKLYSILQFEDLRVNLFHAIIHAVVIVIFFLSIFISILIMSGILFIILIKVDILIITRLLVFIFFDNFFYDDLVSVHSGNSSGSTANRALFKTFCKHLTLFQSIFNILNSHSFHLEFLFDGNKCSLKGTELFLASFSLFSFFLACKHHVRITLLLFCKVFGVIFNFFFYDIFKLIITGFIKHGVVFFNFLGSLK